MGVNIETSLIVSINVCVKLKWYYLVSKYEEECTNMLVKKPKKKNSCIVY